MQSLRASLLFICISVGASTQLRGQHQASCLNSDGLAGYTFSHRGLWIPGYRLLGTAYSVQSCSAACSQHDDCVAFSGTFKEDGGNGACYVYSSTGKNVPSAADRAYKKCPGSHASLPTIPSAVNMVAQAKTSTRTTASKAAAAAPTEQELITMAQTMETQLDTVAQKMAVADAKMRRMKSLVAGVANVLTGASKIASAASEAALTNRVGLKSIRNTRKLINMTFDAMNSSTVQIEKVLKRIQDRSYAGAPIVPQGQTAAPTQAPVDIAKLEPNVTAIEKQLQLLNDPKTASTIHGLVKQFSDFQGSVGTVVKSVVHNNMRGLVDDVRVAYHNYTDVVGGQFKKDPCCAGCKK